MRPAGLDVYAYNHILIHSAPPVRLSNLMRDGGWKATAAHECLLENEGISEVTVLSVRPTRRRRQLSDAPFCIAKKPLSNGLLYFPPALETRFRTEPTRLAEPFRNS